MTSRVELVVESGPLQGQRFAFDTHDVALFGRAADCHIRLPEQDPTASRHHFILEVNPPQARLRDLGSLGGTFVNGLKYGGRAPGESPEEAARRQFPEVDLGHGDEIRAGLHLLRVAVHREVTSPTYVPPATAPPTVADAHTTEVPAATPATPATTAPPVAASPFSPPHAGGDSPLAHLFQQLLGGGWRRPGRGESAEGSRVLGEYEIGQELGRGSVGAVYLARHRQTGERVAVKVMVAQAAVDERQRRRFLREIEATRSLRHPNVVALRGSEVAGDTFYFTMEYCAGGSLREHMAKRGGRLPLAEALPFFEQTLDGMAAAHAAGLIHRDLKPDNVLLAYRDGSGSGGGQGRNVSLVAKVADFGLAKNFADAGLSGLTVTGTRGGTFAFMPREQLVRFRDARPASDVWSLGATFYVLLTGRSPRQPPAGQQLDPITLVLQGEIIPLRQVAPDIPAWLAAVVDRALQREPGARYQSAGEMRQALAAARPRG